MVNFDSVFKKIGVLKSVSSSKEMASILGLSPQDFHNRKKRETLLPVIVEWAINENVDLNWLVKGEIVEEQSSRGAVAEAPILYSTDRQAEVLHHKLQRIFDGGNKNSIEAIKGMLKALDPAAKEQDMLKTAGSGVKKEGLSDEQNESVGMEDRSVA